jgi:putative ABC transport system permease protein
MSRAMAESAGIHRLPMPPWSKAFQMSKNGIMIRLGRSVITASGIFLGIAFLSAVMTNSAVLTSQTVRNLPQMTGGPDPFMAVRNVWLVTVALLVATVGVVNSMLMAVTERYKEIGTMKCLGALDSFIVRLFLVESGMLGILGSIAGAIVGFGGTALISAAKFGWKVFGGLGPAITLGANTIPLLPAVLVAVALGGILSVLAAIYPAWRAAKMPAAAALRMEI